MNFPSFAPLCAAVLLTSLSLPAAMAQSTKSLGDGKPSSGPIMTKEELRACFKQKDNIAAMSQQVEAERKALDEEKAAIMAETKALQGGGDAAAQTNDKIADINARTEALAQRVNDWNERFNAFQKENRSGPIADRQRRALSREKREIEDETAALEAERGKLSGAKGDVAEHNARAKALETRVLAWNDRNAKAVKLSEDALRERDLWAVECASRRYLIDDEKAIQAGQ